jgi:hypothetical protein
VAIQVGRPVHPGLPRRGATRLQGARRTVILTNPCVGGAHAEGSSTGDARRPPAR